MEKVRKKAVAVIVLIAAVCLIFVVGGLSVYGRIQMGKIPDLTFTEALEYTTHNDPEAVITVGIIKSGKTSYKVYGENGKELPAELHTYEIGSLTKTFTAALINKAICDGKISTTDTIDRYLELPEGNRYPTIEELLTHTSGYKGYYFESPMIGNFFRGENSFCGISKDMVLDKVESLYMEQDSFDFKYSNFGYAVLGLVLESVYETSCTTLLNDFAQNELGLFATHISDQSGDLGHYWDWNAEDAYIAAGAITSNIEDMLRYAQIQMGDQSYITGCHDAIKSIDASTDSYKAMGICMDEIGMAWIIDNEHGFVWHNGGTGEYNCYLGFTPESDDAVVVLSNLSPDYRIPATVLGVKLLSEISDQTESVALTTKKDK